MRNLKQLSEFTEGSKIISIKNITLTGRSTRLMKFDTLRIELIPARADAEKPLKSPIYDGPNKMRLDETYLDTNCAERNQVKSLRT